MRTAVGRTREEVLLLAVSATAVAVAAVALRQATPGSPGLWLAAAAALALAATAAFAFWFGGAVRRTLAESLHGEWDAARTVLAALPDGLLLVREGEICSVNRRLCVLLGFDREELLRATAPFPFWAPEHQHEAEAWHARLVASGEAEGEVTLRHRRGDRIRVHLSGRVVPDGRGVTRQLIVVRDVSASHRRERRLTELAARDPETGLFDRREFEARLGDAVRRALRSGTSVTVVLAELIVHGRTGPGAFTRPEALLAVEHLRRLVRADDDLARTGEAELAWILRETDADGGVEALERWRTGLEDVDGVELTAGVCDLGGSGDALALYALADRALAAARRRGPGAIERHGRAAGSARPSG
jgi:PAS domain S-box-containing protein